MAKGFEYTEAKLENLLFNIFEGNTTPLNLPANLFQSTEVFLADAVDTGIGGSLSLGGKNIGLGKALHYNIFQFSAARTFQQTREMSEALVINGEPATFEEFKAKARRIFEKYNGQNEGGVWKDGWLEAEYETAKTQAMNARQWEKIEEQKEIHPYLKWVAVGDERTCPICGGLHGIVRPVTDPIWIGAAHFRCRCIRQQFSKWEGELRLTSKKQAEKRFKEANINPAFQFNPGSSKEVFCSKGVARHPYFMVPKKYKEFAKENFGFKYKEIK